MESPEEKRLAVPETSTDLQVATESGEVEKPQTAPPQVSTPLRRAGLRRTIRVLVVVLGVLLGLSIAAAYAGIQPFALYKDTVLQRMISLDEITIPTPADTYPRSKRFTGTYSTKIPALTLQQSLTFRSDTVTVVDQFAGTLVYRYTVTMESAAEGVLDLEDMGSGRVTRVALEYVTEADCILLYPQGRDREAVTYCR